MSLPIHKLLEILESDENKKRLVLEYIGSQLKVKSANSKDATSSLRKQTKPMFESPAARFRRKALEQMAREEATSALLSNENMPSSESISASSKVESSKPFNEVLTGVIAFVDVTSKGEDRSSIIKTLLKLMGATVRDELTEEVTHVIFKDGSYSTYEKAKLMKTHLVSLLWIQACKTQCIKVPETHYQALGPASYNQDMSLVCSELQQEYNDLIREEYNTSLATGAALPSTQAIIDKRRTLAAINTKKSFSLSQCSTPSNPNSVRRRRTSLFSQKNFSDDDDSDSGAVVNGHIMEKRPSDDTICLSDMDLSDNITSFRNDEFKENDENAAIALSPNCLFNLKTPKICPTSQRLNITTNNATSSMNNLSDSSISDEFYTKRTPKIVRRSKNPGAAADDILALPLDNSIIDQSATELKKTGKQSSISNVNQSAILSKNATKDPPVESSSSMSSLRLSSDKSKEKSTESHMSSLRLSSEHNVLCNNSENSKETINKPLSTVKRKHIDSDKPAEDNHNSEFQGSPPKKLNISNVPENKNDEGSSSVKGQELKSTLNRTNSLNSNKQTSEEYITASDGSETTPAEENKKRQRRKLYNPKDSFGMSVDDEAERTKAKLKAREAEKNYMMNCRVNIQRNITFSLPNNRKLRKLYNPGDDYFNRSVNDETERVNAKLNAKAADENNTTSKFNPPQNIILSSKMKEIITSMDLLDQVLGKNEPTKSSKKPKKQTVIDEDRYEQKELLEEIMQEKNKRNNKKATPLKQPTPEERRKSLRLLTKTPGKDRNDIDSSKMQNHVTPRKEKNGVTPRKERNGVTPRKERNEVTPCEQQSGVTSRKEQNMVTPHTNRRSTMEFQTKSEMSARRRLKIDKVKKPSIVCSRLHHDQVHEFNCIVEKLGSFVTENEVSSKTTHLVLGEPKRTINFLKAMAMGCWILKYEWLLKSSKVGKWLPEEDFEETSISPAVQQCRLQRQAFGPSYSMDIFQECGYIYIEQNTVPKYSDLRDLIILCKGKVTNIKRNATIVIGQPQKSRSPGGTYVKEAWVLDSITMNKKLSFKKYFYEI